MHQRPPSILVLKAFACLLAFFAGGDDFSLARAALPALFPTASSEALPLDDPNTDGVESARSAVPAPGGQDGFCRRRPSRQAALSPIVSTRDGPAPRPSLNPLLRC